MNSDPTVAWRYHNQTKHSATSVRTNRHVLDWYNQPLPFKIYQGLPQLQLPPVGHSSPLPVLAAVGHPGVMPTDEVVPDLAKLARLLFHSAGITKRKMYPGGVQLFRAASCTGALYEIDLYLVCQQLPGLEAGVYHFDPKDFALGLIRPGDFRGVLVRATAGEPATLHAPAVLVCSATYWRNAWKYQARTYRHFGWDNGTILANLLATSASLGLPARINCGFVDDSVNQLLALDADREVAFSLVALGHVLAEPPEPPSVHPLVHETVPLSAREVDYPIMRELHAASSFGTKADVARWRLSSGAPGYEDRRRAASHQWLPLRPLGDEAAAESVEQVIRRRGSTRRFDRRASLTSEQLATILHRATRGIPADFLGTGGSETESGPLLNELYIIVHSVEGIEPGTYVLHRDPWELELLKRGGFRSEASYLGLEQALPGEASAAVFFLADLDAILERLGNRGYRVTQLEAGILGGKLYLGAYALGLGATGLTFYDDDVVEFFSPHARGKSAIFLVALGRSAKLVQTGPW